MAAHPEHSGAETPPPPHYPVRSEALLPADDADPNLQVAEEIAFDLQSDSARRVGALPPDSPVAKPADAVAQSLHGSDGDEAELKDAVERAVPPSPSP